MKLRSTRSTLTAALAASLLLAGCGQGSQTSANEDKDVISYIGDEAAILPQVKAAAAAIEDETGLGFNPRTVQSTENYQQVIRSSLGSNSATALVKWWNGYRLQDLAKSGKLADLSDVWSSAVDKGWINDDTRGSYSYDDKIYGIPYEKSYWVVFYNKHVFEDAGIDAAPTTFDEFAADADKIKKAGVTPFFSTIEPGWTSFIWFEEILSKQDPGLYKNLTSGEAKYTDPEVHQVMETWADWYDKGYFTPADTPWDSEIPMLKDGKVGMTVAGTWRNGAFSAAGMTDADYGAFVLPAADGAEQTVIAESGIFTAPEASGNVDAAKKWLETLMGPKAQTAFVSESKGLSPNPDVSSDDPVLASVKDVVTSSGMPELTRYWEASPPDLIEGNVQDLAAFMADPSTGNIDSSLKSMESRAEASWKQWNG